MKEPLIQSDGVPIRLEESAPTYRIGAWLFLRGLAVVYAVAFLSLWFQWRGLFGSRGLLPAHAFLEQVSSRWEGWEHWIRFPTLFWLGDSDRVLGGALIVGMVGAAGLFFNFAPRILLILLWIIELSVVQVGGVFFHFQWDSLLLESGFLAIFLAPGHGVKKRGEGETPPSPEIRFLFVWLLFRIYFESGVAKLASGDDAWQGFKALAYYYETAPLPTVLGWMAHQLPMPIHMITTILTLFLEMMVPFFFFARVRWRKWPAVGAMLMQVPIMLTGNYAFFNWLSILLFWPMWSDEVMIKWFPRARILYDPLIQMPRMPWLNLPGGIRKTGVVMVIFFTLISFGGLSRFVPGGDQILSFVRPLRSFNGYGLFAIVTRERWELEILGSRDGKEWKAYHFRYKPGALDHMPPFIAPFQPRLDFQCWFLTFDGMGDFRRHPYLISLLKGLGENRPEILDLLGENPFQDAPPAWLQLKVNQYQMTSLTEWWETGRYWRIENSRGWSPLIACPMSHSQK